MIHGKRRQADISVVQQMKNGQYFLTIPKPMAQAASFKKGDSIKFIIKQSILILIKDNEVEENGIRQEES